MKMPVFEYAMVRVVPRVEREEFINVGIILFCKELRFLQMRFDVNRDRLGALATNTDPDQLEQNLRAFQKIAAGEKTDSAIASMDQASRFRWLTATRSTVIQCSKVHPGICTGSPEQALERMFQNLIL